MSQPHTGSAYEKQMVSLGRILSTLREAGDANAAVKIALDHVYGEFDFEVAWIGLYEQVRHRLLTSGIHCPKGARFVRSHLNLTPGDILEQVVIQQRPLIVADLLNEPRAGEWGGLAKQMELQSAVLFPIRRQDVCYGILLLASPRWGLTPSAGERAHLSVLMGFLGESLYQYAAEEQRRGAKRPEQPLLSLLESLRTLEGMDARLRAITKETQAFVRPSRTRIFWLEPQGNYFWERCHSRKLSQKKLQDGSDPAASLTISVPEVRSFYQSLSNDQLIVAGEVQSSVKAPVTERMLQLLKVRSLMVAPIVYQGQVLGFITAEGDSSRIWQEPEKQYLLGVARLIALAMPVSQTDDSLREMQSQQQLTAGIVRGIHSDVDWIKTLEFCSDTLCSQIKAQQFIVLLFDEDLGCYELCFQNQITRSRTIIPNTWPALDDVDWQMLERSSTPITIDDTRHDLKLMAWRDILHSLDICSLIACNVAPGNAPEGIVIVGDKVSRQWTPLECALLDTVSQQIGLILHQWQLQRQMNQQEHIYDAIQWGLRTLQQTFDLEKLEQATTQHLAQLLQVPLAALVTWPINGADARVSQVVIRDSDFAVNEEWEIPVSADAIINWALQTDGILPLNFEDLPDVSRQWIAGPPNSKLLVMLLRTAPDHIPTAVLVIMARPERRWSEYHMQVLSLLANQLAWSRRHLSLMAMLTTQREELEQLNWYKQHRFEELHRFLERQVRRLMETSIQDTSETSERYQQIARQLESLVNSLSPLLSQEYWQLHSDYQTTPLISLLSRLMERVNDLVKQQQLWTKVHNDSNVIIGGEIVKIEFIIHELMVAACQRSQAGGRIDIWCRPIDRNWLELSITDDGTISPELIEELEKGRSTDMLAPSLLDEPPGLHFAICHSLMQQIGGELTLSRLDDNRTLSRVLLPIASTSKRPSLRGGTAISQPFSRRHGR